MEPNTREELEPTIQELLDAGAHYGHQKSNWNPKMSPYIFKVINGICIIDLSATRFHLQKALKTAEETIKKRGRILFVNTRGLAREVVEKAALRCGEFYMCNRWPGGTLTNWNAILDRIKALHKLKGILEEQQENQTLSKKDLMMTEKRVAKLERNLSGIKDMKKLPDLMIVLNECPIAVDEARSLGVPMVRIVDTDGNPDSGPSEEYIVPCNDNSAKVTSYIAELFSMWILRAKQELGISVENIGTSDGSIGDLKVEDFKEK